MVSAPSPFPAEHHGPAPMPHEVDTAAAPPPAPPTFMSLPEELHLAIASHLTYPDALSLKQTNRRMRRLVNTDMPLKVEWLLERRRLHLECPNSHSCDLGSDLRFCRGSVPLLMRRRREHYECESRPGLGCLVYGTAKCVNKPKSLERCKRWLRRNMPFDLLWAVLTLLPVVLVWFWALFRVQSWRGLVNAAVP